MDTNVKVLDQERPFKYHELFFSITDSKSNITYANDVFIRISGYQPEEIVGELHKVIRHPHMPRSVFKIFWDHLNENKPVAAYVKNLAKNGAYYWVMALALPCDGGYMSIRLKPGSNLFDKVQRIYRNTLKYEKKKETELGKRKGMYQSEEYIIKALKEEGYSSYDDFMWNALKKEMRNRENELEKQNFDFFEEAQNVPSHLKALQMVLGKLFTRLESLSNLHDVLLEHSDYMLKLSRSILLLSINAQVSSARLDGSDDSISVVAENMGMQTQKGEEQLLDIQGLVKELNELLRSLNFDIISSKLQVEMANSFLHELTGEQNIDNFNQEITGETTIDLLYHGFVPKLTSIQKSVRQLPRYIRDLRSQVDGIEKFLQILRYIHTTGKIEVSKMTQKASSFKTTFQDLIAEVDSAQTRLEELSDVLYNNEITSSIFAESETTLQNAVLKINAK
ncbi:PAS domain-containing protein [Fodinibius sp. AD559]|uniref:PAS domain-containing protein n=1 Tax=Fodinibius sp. AD559 TaxID=3424179 RepID=UPI004046AE0F